MRRRAQPGSQFDETLKLSKYAVICGLNLEKVITVLSRTRRGQSPVRGRISPEVFSLAIMEPQEEDIARVRNRDVLVLA